MQLPTQKTPSPVTPLGQTPVVQPPVQSDTDQLNGVISSVTSQLKAQKAPQEDIDKATNSIYQYYGNYQQQKALQANGGIGSTMASNALKSSMQNANQFAASPEATAGVIAPINPENGNASFGGAVTEVSKILPNALSDAWGIAKGAFSLLNPENWPGIVNNILKDPASLAGPALEQAFYGVVNSISDVAGGKFGKAGSDLTEGTKKALVAFGNHPLTSIIGPMVLADGINAISHPIDTATSLAEKTGTVLSTAKNAVTDPMGTAGELAARVAAPFKASFNKFSQSGSDAALQSALSQSMGSISAVKSVNDALMARPDWTNMYQSLLAKADEIRGNTGMPIGNLSSLFKTVGLDPTINPEFTGLINKLDLLNQSIPGGVDAIRQYMQTGISTMQSGAEQGGDSSALTKAMLDKGKLMESTAQDLYTRTLNDENGKPIPVSADNTIKTMDAYLKDSRINGNINPEKLSSLYDMRDELVLRQALNDTNYNLPEAEKLIQSKYDGLLNKDRYTNIASDSKYQGVVLPKGLTPINWDSINSQAYLPIDGVGLKNWSDRLLSDTQKLTDKTNEVAGAHTDIMKPAVNSDLRNAIEDTNPEGWSRYQEAQATYAKYATNAERFGLKGGQLDPDVISKSVFENWDQFKQAFPKLIPQAQEIKMAQILDGVMKPDGLGGYQVNFKGLQDAINDNMNILNPSQINELSGIISANKLADQLSNAHGLVNDELVAQAKSTEEAAGVAKENAKVSPTDTVDFEMRARSVKSLSDLENLSSVSGMTPEQLGNVAARSILEEISAKFGTKQGFTPDDIAGFNTELSKIGGGSESADVINQMFPKTKDGKPNMIRSQFDNLQQLFDNYKAARSGTSKTLIGRAINISAGVLLMNFGHTFMGFGMMRRGLGRTGAGETVGDFGIPTETTAGFDAMSKPPGILSQATDFAKKVAKKGIKPGAELSTASLDNQNQ